MESTPTTLTGVVHGKTIELDQAPGLPEGQPVHVTVEPMAQRLTAGEGIRRSAGAWSDEGDELDNYLQWNRQRRKTGRLEIAE